jgi:hypothetical protein
LLGPGHSSGILRDRIRWFDRIEQGQYNSITSFRDAPAALGTAATRRTYTNSTKPVHWLAVDGLLLAPGDLSRTKKRKEDYDATHERT